MKTNIIAFNPNTYAKPLPQHMNNDVIWTGQSGVLSRDLYCPVRDCAPGERVRYMLRDEVYEQHNHTQLS